MNNATRIIFLFTALALSAGALGDDDDRGGRSERSGWWKSERKGPKVMPVVTHAQWKAECGTSCHMAFHPGFLPAASWQKLMAGLDKHFGADASMDAVTAKEITRFLVQHSADHAPHRWSAKLLSAVAPGEIAITRTGWFSNKHRELSAAIWKHPQIGSPANCIACHVDAERGDYDEHGVRLPR